MGTSTTCSSSAKVDFALVVLCRVWSSTELAPRLFHVGAVQNDVSSVATYCAECVQADLREAVCLMALSTELYAILDHLIFVLCADHINF